MIGTGTEYPKTRYRHKSVLWDILLCNIDATPLFPMPSYRNILPNLVHARSTGSSDKWDFIECGNTSRENAAFNRWCLVPCDNPFSESSIYPPEEVRQGSTDMNALSNAG